jgi:Raf kinase inhibitor-like YbhB/YbcL family protein
VRRIALLTSLALVATVIASCRHDGRTLREPGPDQNQSISTSSQPAIIDDPIGSFDTLLPSEDFFTATAPWPDFGTIPAKYTCDGDNVSPALNWTPAPEGTVEIAITFDDLDAPDFVHWVIAGLDADSIALDEDTVPIGAIEATNGAGDIGYTGPCPSAGGTHTYRITVHYLSTPVDLDDGSLGADMIARISQNEIGAAVVDGTYQRG